MLKQNSMKICISMSCEKRVCLRVCVCAGALPDNRLHKLRGKVNALRSPIECQVKSVCANWADYIAQVLHAAYDCLQGEESLIWCVPARCSRHQD